MKYGEFEKLLQDEMLNLTARILDQVEHFGVDPSPTPLPMPGVGPMDSVSGLINKVKVATEPGAATGFKWGPKSLKELSGVKTALVECATLALERFTRIDFICHDGIRTTTEQAQHVKNGTSKTMKSKHLDGLAVDLVPIIGGIPKWDWNGCYEIACAMDKAATFLGIADKIIWGGAWDKRLSQYGGEAAAYAQAVQDYRTRHAGSDFIDGPHFEGAD